ncbi:hypothetical protein BJI69_21295 [Luteibacter rhizovicinus DSM 16549]|uniref:Antitoxin Xre/MbcA/ParS-like toxin-binding domain-containing protein n=1 Tax=Luteibacter rhizovicinus DSM 16549 TaxID=1440763 RepID=A0A1L3EYN9_9GAMM|nr:antitoxin Xre-like helix-turn-helix domain-containing protein [Luteibacter rhizovicinus]APG06189.1 hypothetical protein BJI69_21295 [Luteibacter rhizovicinus DSM 16549]KLD77455.1 hypothetical protein Y886_15660 [Xanthomonas hyacinthi DSM 19077]
MAVTTEITVRYASYIDLIQATPDERMERVRRGFQPAWLAQLAHDLRVPDRDLALYLGLNRAMLRRRVVDEERLSTQESEGLMAMASLAGKVIMACRHPSVERAIVADPLAWLGRWLRTPVTTGADGRRAPIQYMDVAEGRAVVAAWLSATLSPDRSP